MSAHRIFEAGGEGTRPTWRPFCACGWVGLRTAHRSTYDRMVARHLAAVAA